VNALTGNEMLGLGVLGGMVLALVLCWVLTAMSKETTVIIDWTKPVELTDGTPVRVERVIDNERAIVSWVATSDGVMHVEMAYTVSNWLRNVPPKPREWWLVFEANGSTQVWNLPPSPETNAFNRTFVHVREVLEDK
jgi:hypothetical protein